MDIEKSKDRITVAVMAEDTSTLSKQQMFLRNKFKQVANCAALMGGRELWSLTE